MRKLASVTACAAIAALLVAALASATSSERSASPAPLPADVAARGHLRIGVKCDVPPFGYVDAGGRNRGFEVEIGRWLARYAFGSPDRVRFVCITAAKRDALIEQGRVDLVLATFTYTSERAQRIGFSEPYYRASGRLLVRRGSAIRTVNDLEGHAVATTSGSVYARWLGHCFPGTTVVDRLTYAQAKQAFLQGRADALMLDDVALLPLAAADPRVTLTPDAFLVAPFGIGMRKAASGLRAWVDARLELMRRQDRFYPILKAAVPPRFLPSFSRNILRPHNTFGYAPRGSPSVDTVCP